MEGRVSEGAKWCDRHAPGWFAKIDTDRLLLSSCSRCVLGQLFGSYARIVDLESRISAIHSMRQHWWGRAHGFTLDHRLDVPAVGGPDSDKRWEERARQFGILRDLWVTEILSRQFIAKHEQAAQPQPVAVEA
jgi:hypothetical protein